MIWADEIFQTLEQGHRLAFGYGLVPWEFRVGARSWLLPGVIAGVMKLFAFFGVGSGAGLATGLKLLFRDPFGRDLLSHVAHGGGMGGVFALVLLGVVASVFPAGLIYGSRAMAEVASALFLSWGLWLLWPWGMGRAGKAAAYSVLPALGSRWNGMRVLVLAGVLFGLATVLRYQSGILLAAVLNGRGGEAERARGRRGGRWCGRGLLLGGLLDWATWGSRFNPSSPICAST